MHWWTWLAAAVLVWAGQDSGTLPRYGLVRTDDAMVVDGRLNEAAWSRAEAVELQYPDDGSTGAASATTVRLLWDGAYLYAAFECEDPDIHAVQTERDAYVFTEDCVEIYLTPGPESTGLYFGFEMNARGTLYDYLYVNLDAAGAPIVPGFDAQGALVATELRGTPNMSGDTDEGWTLEAAIPLEALRYFEAPPPAAGKAWRMNLVRLEGKAPHRRFSLWSLPAAGEPVPHSPGAFGYLVFQ